MSSNQHSRLHSGRQARWQMLLLLAVWPLLPVGCGTESSVSSPAATSSSVSVTEQSASAMAASPSRSVDLVEVGYVGSQQCVECHAEIAASYLKTPMGRSMDLIPPTRPVEGPPGTVAVEAPGPRNYSVTHNDSGMTHSEELHASDGSLIYSQAVPMHYVVGSGHLGRTYLTRRGPVMFMSSLGWYTGGQKWGLSPGYLPDNHQRFERRIADGCIVCHAGLLRPASEGLHRFQEEPFQELSIGCERCHGPGQKHIEWHRDDAATDSNRPAADPIVNPSRLPIAERESVCLQCHVLGSARILRTGRSEFSFRPGELLSDCWTVWVTGDRITPDGRSTGVVSQVQQIMSSRCYQQSQGELGCISCHDVHASRSGSELTTWYRTRCLDCHTDGTHCSMPEPSRRETSAEDSCVACHMPTLDASDVPHTSQTDHRILARRGQVRTSPEAESGIHPLAANLYPVPPDELERAMGLAMARQAEASGDPSLMARAIYSLDQSRQRQAGDVPVLDSLSTLVLRSGSVDAANTIAEEACELNNDQESVVETLVMISVARNDIEAGLRWSEKLVELNPWYSQAQHWRATFLAKDRQSEAAILHAERATELNPTRTDTRRLLIELYEAVGRDAEATDQLKKLKALEAAMRTGSANAR